MLVKHKALAGKRMKPQGERRPKGYAPTAPRECMVTIDIYDSGL
jgi:hypothetical protein